MIEVDGIETDPAYAYGFHKHINAPGGGGNILGTAGEDITFLSDNVYIGGLRFFGDTILGAGDIRLESPAGRVSIQPWPAPGLGFVVGDPGNIVRGGFVGYFNFITDGLNPAISLKSTDPNEAPLAIVDATGVFWLLYFTEAGGLEVGKDVTFGGVGSPITFRKYGMADFIDPNPASTDPVLRLRHANVAAQSLRIRNAADSADILTFTEATGLTFVPSQDLDIPLMRFKDSGNIAVRYRVNTLGFQSETHLEFLSNTTPGAIVLSLLGYPDGANVSARNVAGTLVTDLFAEGIRTEGDEAYFEFINEVGGDRRISFAGGNGLIIYHEVPTSPPIAIRDFNDTSDLLTFIEQVGGVAGSLLAIGRNAELGLEMVADGDQYIYFYDGAARRGQYMRWDNAALGGAGRFNFSRPVKAMAGAEIGEEGGVGYLISRGMPLNLKSEVGDIELNSAGYIIMNATDEIEMYATAFFISANPAGFTFYSYDKFVILGDGDVSTEPVLTVLQDKLVPLSPRVALSIWQRCPTEPSLQVRAAGAAPDLLTFVETGGYVGSPELQMPGGFAIVGKSAGNIHICPYDPPAWAAGIEMTPTFVDIQTTSGYFINLDEGPPARLRVGVPRIDFEGGVGQIQACESILMDLAGTKEFKWSVANAMFEFNDSLSLGGGAGTYFWPPRMTTAQRDAMSAGWGAGQAGRTIYNTTTNQWEGWNGTAWGIPKEVFSATWRGLRVLNGHLLGAVGTGMPAPKSGRISNVCITAQIAPTISPLVISVENVTTATVANVALVPGATFVSTVVNLGYSTGDLIRIYILSVDTGNTAADFDVHVTW